jgi:hypothetical protein
MSNNTLPTYLSGYSLSSLLSFESDWIKNTIKNATNMDTYEYLEQLAAEIKIASVTGYLEHWTARYAMTLFQLFFIPDTWTLVPQWIVKNGIIPDLAIETLTHIPVDQTNRKTLYRKALVEFKKEKDNKEKKR